MVHSGLYKFLYIMTEHSDALNNRESPWTPAIRMVLGYLLLAVGVIAIRASSLSSAFLFVAGCMLSVGGLLLVVTSGAGRPEPLVELGVNQERKRS